MSRNDIRQQWCDEVARLLAHEPTARALRLLQWTDLMAGPQEPEAGSARPAKITKAEEAAPDKGAEKAVREKHEAVAISIWQPRLEEGRLAFVRPPVGPLGDHYASWRRIEAEKAPGVTRICFLGESVAAGYLYAPHWTPARALEHKLGEAFALAEATSQVEVVDLARTNETLQGLVTTVRACRQLAPDALVLFAGNNWNLLETPQLSPYLPSVRGRQEIALALRDGGLEGVVALGEKLLRRAVEHALAAIAQAAGPLPVVFVEPEVNLLDWRARQPVPWLPGDGVARWYSLLAQAEARLSQEPAAAEAIGRQLVELDRGLCPTSHRSLAEALLAQGRAPEAEEALRREVETERYALLGFLGAPRLGDSCRRWLHQAARQHGFHRVSLPDVFAREGGGALPGSRFFLDYCHLTAEGIDVAMAATAHAVAEALGQSPPAAAELRRRFPPPALDGELAALAYLGAAVHGSHRWAGDKKPLLRGWVERALDASPWAVEACQMLLEARSAPLAAVWTSAQRRSAAAAHSWTLQHGWRWDSLDADLLEVLVEALEARGVAVREDLADRLLRSLAAAASGPVDLLGRRYLWDPVQRLYPEAMEIDDLPARFLFRAAWPASSFCLVAEIGGGRVEATLRLAALPGVPANGRQGEVVLAVNGQELARWPVGERWSRHRIQVGGQGLRRGLNRLTLHWPLPPACGDEALEGLCRRLEQGLEADLHPIFGEVAALDWHCGTS
jgi:hypothetical protein